MIRLFNEETLPAFDVNWQSTYITSRFLAYGGNAAFAPFYIDDNNTVLSVLNGHGILYTTQTDIEEWACFLAMHPDITTVTASLETAEALAKALGRTTTKKKIMRLTQTLPLPAELVTEQMPRQVYPLLSDVFGDTMPAFEDWYVDVSHRLRHDNCIIAGITWEQETVSTAMTVAQAPNAVVIGAVATAQKARKRGFAAQCIAYLANKNVEKEIMISPKNPYAERLYTEMGFVVTDTIAHFNIKEEN